MKMGKRLLSFILMALSAALLWSGLVMAQEGNWLPITFTRYYTGTIDGKPIEMILERTGSQLTGRYCYVDKGVNLKLTGHIEANGNLFLEERGPNRITGLFRGKFVTGSRAEGKWIRPDGTQPMGFVLEGKVASTSLWQDWLAEREVIDPLRMEISWEGTIDGSQAISMWLKIWDGNITGSYYYDNLKKGIPLTGTIQDGRILLAEYGEPGKLTGRFEGNICARAIWDFPQDMAPDASQRMAYTKVTGYWISPGDSRILPWYMEVQYSRIFYGDPWQGNRFQFYDLDLDALWFHEKQQTLKTLGIFKTETEEQAFVKTVGPEMYYSFLEVFELADERKDLDGFGSYVHHGCMSRFREFLQGMIMVTPDGKVWAARLYGSEIQYYTNVPAYAARLPKTMEVWVKDLERAGSWSGGEDKILYMSAGI